MNRANHTSPTLHAQVNAISNFHILNGGTAANHLDYFVAGNSRKNVHPDLEELAWNIKLYSRWMIDNHQFRDALLTSASQYCTVTYYRRAYPWFHQTRYVGYRKTRLPRRHGAGGYIVALRGFRWAPTGRSGFVAW
jgi:hypothetical protein